MLLGDRLRTSCAEGLAQQFIASDPGKFGKDIDATRHAPPVHKLDAEEVAAAIRGASIQNVVQFVPEEPATDSARSLDFDKVHVTGDVIPDSDVQVEVSYREEVVGTPGGPGRRRSCG